MTIRRTALLAAATLLVLLAGRFVLRQRDRLRMKVTITHMRTISAAIDAYRLAPAPCEQLWQASRHGFSCTDGSGDPIYVGRAPSGTGHRIWAGNARVEAAPFVLENGRFTRLPADAPP